MSSMLCYRRDIFYRSWDSASLKKKNKKQKTKKNSNKKSKKQKTKRNWHFIIRKTEIQFWGINKDYSRIINPGRIPIPE